MTAASMDTAHLDPALRARMTAAYRRILPEARRGWHDGEPLMFGVPKWVVRAWVLAVFTGKDTAAACAAAHLGAETVEEYASRPDWAGLRLGRLWASRLAAIEVLTRDAAPGAAP